MSVRLRECAKCLHKHVNGMTVLVASTVIPSTCVHSHASPFISLKHTHHHTHLSGLMHVLLQVDTLAFANFSHALMVPSGGGTGLVEVAVDYTKQPLTQDAEYRDKVSACVTVLRHKL